MLDTDPEPLYSGFPAYMHRIAQIASKRQQERLEGLKERGIEPTARYLRALCFIEYVQHRTKMGLGVFASEGVISEEVLPFQQVRDVLE